MQIWVDDDATPAAIKDILFARFLLSRTKA